jgi:hypothetical protein
VGQRLEEPERFVGDVAFWSSSDSMAAARADLRDRSASGQPVSSHLDLS